ncbi:Ovarian-specific serine/threonine-protein kinase Lok [Eufriesea mexicana]|nr:Ovarian-specific serine/threonine-protein kinase Lok [Eufriesea mexicana]
MTIWGRLCPIKLPFKTMEMTKDVYTLGRSENCDVCVTNNELKPKWLCVISKVHFKITREFIDGNTNDVIVYLQDLSQNGTFVNKKKVGRGNKVILESNDIISLAQSAITVYVFMSTIAFESNNLPPQLKNKYAVSRKLGSGACGEVKMVFNKVDCKKFAMKTIMKIGGTTNGQKHPLNDPEKIMNEVKILKALKHPCIIRMEEIVDTPKAVYIVLELMEGGELFERIKSKGRLSEKYAKLIFYQVVLAPENILLASNSDITLAKVSDFGLSKLVDAQTMMKTFCGTPMYVAPEILSNIGRGSYTNQVDVWSLGVILYACLSGSVPFNCQDKNISLQDQIKRGYYCFPSSKFGHISNKAIDLV